ncbi:protein-glucosylgalactosylhydroxylysine glucosidase-like [Amphiura filiformis]|uniref:protein-glucosylgalactosylhydroxylysine glucosidase-like n=1 Tax=Amphiura filiformis TaxID=82378 RepID=UPI003B21BE1A
MSFTHCIDKLGEVKHIVGAGHFKMEYYKMSFIYILLGLCMVPSMFSLPAADEDVHQNAEWKSSRHKRASGQRDISTQPLIFESTSLPVSGNAVDTRYMPVVGNGHLATTIYSNAIYVNGLYNGRLGTSHRARIPSYNAIRVDFRNNADKVDATRSYQLQAGNGLWISTLETPEVTVSVVIYAHQYYHHLLITRVAIARKETETGKDIELSVTNNRGPDSEDIDFRTEVSCAGINIPEMDCKYITGTIKEPETTGSEKTVVHVYYTGIPNTLTLTAAEGSKSWLFATSIDITSSRQAQSAYGMLRDLSLEELEGAHVRRWRDNWDDGRIEIDGSLELKKILYASQYYLKSSLPAPETHQSKNEFFGVSPGGLGRGAEGMDYQGHVFWDQETWILPPILLLQPSAAKDMLKYRIERMRPAYKRALEDEYQGLRFPWESASTGEDVTPDTCIACRENEQHVTADIAFAARLYVAATRDMRWLEDEDGCEFIIDMAKFWVSRAKYDANMDRYHIRGVMPPDEYHTKVDDSVYTNVGASLSIHMANYTACLCEQRFPEEWDDVASKLHVLYDEDKDYHPEFDGYSPEDTSQNEAFSNITNEKVKQADAILLGYPFTFDFTNREARRNDLNIYRGVTDESAPGTTWAMFSIGYREIGDDDQQRETFEKSYKPYVCEPFKVWTEASEGVGATNFLTGMGGFLQAILFGYAGFRLQLESLYFNATLPPGATALKMVDMDYLGAKLNMEFNRDQIKIVLKEMNPALPLEIELLDEERVVVLKPGPDEFVYRNQAARFYTSKSSGCLLPPDRVLPLKSGATDIHRTHRLLFVVLSSLLLCWYAVHRR